jgi:DNA polymerase-4/protein ImuB
MRLHARQLLHRALRQPRAARRFVRSVRLRAITEDGRLWERAQTLREPTGDRDRLWIVLQSFIEYSEFPGLISELELELAGLTSEQARQTGLFIDHARRREQLDEMVRQLKARFGRSPMTQVVEVEPWSRLPERRFALMDYDP